MITYKGRQIPQTLAEIIDPRHTALLVHEMINDTVSVGGELDKFDKRMDISGMIGNVKEFLSAARQSGVRVVYARMTRYPDYGTYSDPMILKAYPQIEDPTKQVTYLVGIKGSWGWQVIDELRPEPGDLGVDKYRVNSFINTPLELLLRSNGIRTIVILGVGAEAGIVPTVTHAENLGFFVVAVEDCILPVDHSWRDAAFKFISRFSLLATSSEISSIWKSFRMNAATTIKVKLTQKQEGEP